SILSYSYTDVEQRDGALPKPAESAAALRRRNTTGLMRRKTFIERVNEDDGDAPFLVQSTAKSSLKRSRLANKRRDSSASTGSARRGRRKAHEATTPSVSSPLAPPVAAPEDDDEEVGLAGTALPPSEKAPEGRRMSTAEILKQITAEVEDFGFDDFNLDELGSYSKNSMSSPPPPAFVVVLHQHQQHQRIPSASHEPEEQLHQQQQQQPRKTVTHKKSGSWWQWGGKDKTQDSSSSNSVPEPAARSQSDNTGRESPALAGPAMHHAHTMSEATPPRKAKLPSPISFLNRKGKGKKDHHNGHSAQQQAARTEPPANGSSPTPPPPSNAAPSTASAAQDADSDVEKRAESAGKPIPSILTPQRPPPTARLGTGSNRLPIHIERAIYRLASIKLANPRRPLQQQVLLSNMMFWYLELINPRSQQAQHQPPSSPGPNQQQGPQQQQQMDQQQQQQQQQQSQQQQQRMMRQASNNYPQGQQQQQQQNQQPAPMDTGDRSDRRGGKRSGQKSRDSNGGRRRSSGTHGGGSAGGERVVMRSPQYERQQQQIYMSPAGYNMQPGHQQQQPFRTQSPVSNHSGSDLDEDDDVPLALYRGERNAMSIG
ncbi:hypothetical protein EC988_002622, partial [Linderina pennispora]